MFQKERMCFSRYPDFLRDQIKLGVSSFPEEGYLMFCLGFVTHPPKSFWQKKYHSQRWVGPRVL